MKARDRLARGLRAELGTMPAELRAWVLAHPEEANLRWRARQSGKTLHARYGEEAAPVPGERGYRPPPPPGAIDPRKVAARTLGAALTYLEEPELFWSYEHDRQIHELGFDPDLDDEDAEESGIWPLADLIGVPGLDYAGEPLSEEERRLYALQTVRLAMATRGDAEDEWGLGDPERGGTIVPLVDWTVPEWAAEALLTDAYQPHGELALVPVTREAAEAFVRQHHSKLPYINWRGLLYALGVARGGRLVGVATAGHPTGRWDRGDIDPRNVLEITRVATDATVKNAASMLVGRLIDLLPLSRRGAPDAPALLVTYSLLSEKGATYRALADKGLRPTKIVGGKRQAKGSARGGGVVSLGEACKVRWEAGEAAGPARWDLIGLDARVPARCDVGRRAAG